MQGCQTPARRPPSATEPPQEALSTTPSKRVCWPSSWWSVCAIALAVSACGGDDAEPAAGPDRERPDAVADAREPDLGDDAPPTDASDVTDSADEDAPTADTAGDTLPDTGDTACRPSELRCDGARGRRQCNEAGDGWVPLEACSDQDVCLDGRCVSPCEVGGKFEGSTVGCEFWSVDLGQWHVREGEFSLDPSVSVVPHAVLIGNPGDRPATVRFERADGTTIDVPDPVVAPGDARSFLMPVLSQQDTGVRPDGIHVLSTQPVIATQFNPANNAPGFNLHSTDASLLYPVDMLGTYHVAISQYGVEGFAGGPASLGYLTVVAVESGTTTVSILPRADTEAGDTIPSHPAGERFSVQLERGEVFNLNAIPRPLMSTRGGDLTGTLVTSDKRVAVFGGHQCMVVVGGNCDHLESQLLPLERWGTRYVAVPFGTPDPTSVYRVVSAQPNNRLSTVPPVAGLEGVTLGAGEWVEVRTAQAFELTATLPVQVAQFMAGNTEGSSYLVDTSMTVLVPVEQYRTNYPLLVPEDFAVDRLLVVRRTGTDTTLNGAAIASTWRAIGTSGLEFADVTVDDGVQLLESTVPFGVISYGYANKVSYAVPGGMGAPE